MILKTLKTAIGFYGPNLRSEAMDIYNKYLLSVGAIKLLYVGIYSNITKLIGRWHKDEILMYLHMQAEPLMRNFSRIMITHGNYSFLPHQEDTCF